MSKQKYRSSAVSNDQIRFRALQCEQAITKQAEEIQSLKSRINYIEGFLIAYLHGRDIKTESQNTIATARRIFD